MLFSDSHNAWKISDFGLTSEGTSSLARTTSSSRGTAGYRAPELVGPNGGQFNNKVDVWSMGCILFKLFTGRNAFENDYSIFRYMEDRQQIEIGESEGDSEWRSDVLSAVRNMLQINPRTRTPAREWVSRFTDYGRRSGVNTVTNSTFRLLYTVLRSSDATIRKLDMSFPIACCRSRSLIAGFSDGNPPDAVIVIDIGRGTTYTTPIPSPRYVRGVRGLGLGLSFDTMGTGLLAVVSRNVVMLKSPNDAIDVMTAREMPGLTITAIAICTRSSRFTIACGGSDHLTLFELVSDGMAAFRLGIPTPILQAPGCEAVAGLAFQSDGQRVCTVSLGGRIAIYNIAGELSFVERTIMHTYQGAAEHSFVPQFQLERERFMIPDAYGVIIGWIDREAEPIRFKTNSWVVKLCPSPCGYYICTVNFDNEVMFWDRTGNFKGKFTAPGRIGVIGFLEGDRYLHMLTENLESQMGFDVAKIDFINRRNMVERMEGVSSEIG